MAEPIFHKRDPSGPEVYLYNGWRIGVSRYFIYEISIGKYWKGGYCLLGNKYLKTEILLTIKKTCETQKFKGYTIIKDISLVSAPRSFIEENHLPIWEPYKKKENGTSRSSKRSFR